MVMRQEFFLGKGNNRLTKEGKMAWEVITYLTILVVGYLVGQGFKGVHRVLDRLEKKIDELIDHNKPIGERRMTEEGFGR
jgi:hypothetical protein